MIHLSKAAASEIRRLQAKRQHPNAKLRLGVKTGGCSELYYNLDFDEAVHSSDVVYDCNGIPVVVDSESLKYTNGLTLDYTEDLMGGGFRFHNPNAVDSCGCGNSFSVSDASGSVKHLLQKN